MKHECDALIIDEGTHYCSLCGRLITDPHEIAQANDFHKMLHEKHNLTKKEKEKTNEKT